MIQVDAVDQQEAKKDGGASRLGMFGERKFPDVGIWRWDRSTCE